MIATVPHYPTSAELAAFRRTFVPGHLVDAMHPSPEPDGTPPGALTGWPNERRDGIGNPFLPDFVGLTVHSASPPSIARREAAAMRSRAYDRTRGVSLRSDPPGWWSNWAAPAR